MSKIATDNVTARKAWSANARFWDARMADGNDFFKLLVWPSVQKLLQPQRGELVLDIACGNGVTSHRLAQTGAHAVAIDFCDEMIQLARERHSSAQLDYRVVD